MYAVLGLKYKILYFKMVFWNEIKFDDIDIIKNVKDDCKCRYKLDGIPLRFQIPRGMCRWGVGIKYKSIVIDFSNVEFLKWWKSLEELLCPQTPFASNLNGNSLRMKIDDATYVFDENSNQTIPTLVDGLFKGQELSCLITIDSNYFYNDKYGLVVRVVQIKHYGEAKVETETEEVATLKECAFI
jgi:hypothetical protein